MAHGRAETPLVPKLDISILERCQTEEKPQLAKGLTLSRARGPAKLRDMPMCEMAKTVVLTSKA